jgi:hopene-associated glycosyltransferase HpnB
MLAASAVVSLLALLGWLYLLAGHGWFWRTDQRLPRVSWTPREWPTVAVVVPARDEAAILPQTLPSLLAQDYPGELLIVLVDDQSADGTAGVARALAVGVAAGRELLIVEGGEPPPDWAGKVWAMAQGADAAAGRASAGQPGYVLFTDADVAHPPGSVTALVRAAEGDRRDLVSQMALLRTGNGWERAVVPAFVYFFAMLYPFRRVNRPGARTAAAAGGCMLVRSQALAEAGGLARIRGARIDDVALGQLLARRPGGRVWVGLTTGVRSRRPYPRLADLWAMVARSAYTQLRYSPLLLAGTVAGLALLFAVPPLAAAGGLVALALGAGGTGAAPLAATGLATWAIMSLTWVPMLRLYRLSPLRAPALPLLALVYTAMTVDSARRHHTGGGAAWKGRTLRRRPRAMA